MVFSMPSQDTIYSFWASTSVSVSSSCCRLTETWLDGGVEQRHLLLVALIHVYSQRCLEQENIWPTRNQVNVRRLFNCPESINSHNGPWMTVATWNQSDAQVSTQCGIASTELPRRRRQMEPSSLASRSRRPPDPASGREAVKGTWTGWLVGSSI